MHMQLRATCMHAHASTKTNTYTHTHTHLNGCSTAIPLEYLQQAVLLWTCRWNQTHQTESWLGVLSVRAKNNQPHNLVTSQIRFSSISWKHVLPPAKAIRVLVLPRLRITTSVEVMGYDCNLANAGKLLHKLWECSQRTLMSQTTK